MRKFHLMTVFAVALGLTAATAPAQTPQKSGGSSGIVCWKDKNGKVIGCGDKVPPEYQDNANKVLNRRR